MDPLGTFCRAGGNKQVNASIPTDGGMWPAKEACEQARETLKQMDSGWEAAE